MPTIQSCFAGSLVLRTSRPHAIARHSTMAVQGGPSMNRRAFLKMTAALPAVAAFPGLTSPARAQHKEFSPRPGTWRTFEITTRVEVVQPSGASRVWLTVPAVVSDYQQPIESNWTGNAKVARVVTEPKYGAAMLYAEFVESETAPVVELTSRFKTQDRTVDWSRKMAVKEDTAALKSFTAPTDLLPTDGIVKETAVQITKGQKTDLERVKAVYDWILANTYREPKVRGCGVGDIKAMLETKNFGGKCADLNGLFVGLVRSVGVPARDVYGIRVAPSAFGYKSLGAGSATISKAQRCRAEVVLAEYGWGAGALAGLRWIPLTSPRRRARRRARGSRSTTRWSPPCARSSSAAGRATGWRSTWRTTSPCPTRRGSARSAF